jgi:hypothetical protein
MSAALPGPLFALTIDPEPEGDGERSARLVHVHTSGRSLVAVFTSPESVARWRAENAPKNSVLRTMTLGTVPEVLGFLSDLTSNGDTDVCFDPTRTGGAVVPIAELVRKLGGSA